LDKGTKKATDREKTVRGSRVGRIERDTSKRLNHRVIFLDFLIYLGIASKEEEEEEEEEEEDGWEVEEEEDDDDDDDENPLQRTDRTKSRAKNINIVGWRE
jgi:hypothetical protein